MRKNTKLIGSIAVVVAAVLWSLDGLLRSKLYSLPPLTLIFAEHLVGTLFVAPFLIANYKKIKPLTKSQLWTLLGVGVVSSLLGTLLFTAAFFKVNFANFSVVVLSQQLQPVFAILTASLLLKEKVDSKFIMLAAAGIAGFHVNCRTRSPDPARNRPLCCGIPDVAISPATHRDRHRIA